MSVAERIDQLCKFEGSQKVFAEKTGITQGALSAIITRGSQVRSDTIALILKAYPTLNARWLITGQSNMWEGPPPQNLKNLPQPDQTATTPEQHLLNRLLIQKLEEVARALKEKDPALYRELRLEELIGRGR